MTQIVGLQIIRPKCRKDKNKAEVSYFEKKMPQVLANFVEISMKS